MKTLFKEIKRLKALCYFYMFLAIAGFGLAFAIWVY